MNAETQTQESTGTNEQETKEAPKPLYGPTDLTYLSNEKFTFKQRTIKDDDGKEIGKAKKQPAVTVPLLFYTPLAIATILQSEDPAFKKQQDLIMEAVNGQVRAQAKSQFDAVIEGFEDENKTIAPTDLDHDKLTLEYIASIEPKARGVAAISDEEWQAMFQDYLVVMVRATGKPEAKIKNHIELFKKPTKIRQNTEVITVLVDQLNIYCASSGAIEETGECAMRLKNRFEGWLKAEAPIDVDAL